MSDKRKLGPIRQLSLQSDNNNRMRPILKKQISVEQLDRIEDDHHKRQPRIESANAKNKLSDRPRPIKVAWAENRTSTPKDETSQKNKFTEIVEVKKCKEHKRPTTAKLRSQSSLEKESVLYTRQELAERLRKAWKLREDNKQNLDIFLTQNNKQFDELENENYYPDYENNECGLEKTINTTEDEIIAQFKPTTFINSNSNSNNKVCKIKTTENEFNYIPSTKLSRPHDRTITNISVTIPSVNSLLKHQPVHQDYQDASLSPSSSLDIVKTKSEENQAPKRLVKQSSLMSPKENLPPPTSTPISTANLTPTPTRPLTASSASKRESFQKRTNTAFTGSITSVPVPIPIRPPLTRALSVPVKSENNKLKFIATKRRIKSARKRTKETNTDDQNDPKENDDKTNKKSSRCKSAPNGDVVTMVSLVSPAGSDTEENVTDTKKVEQKGRNLSPVKNQQTNFESVNKTIALRKSIKSVSFQQSSIHAVRSFSASFPARRGILTSAGSVASVFPEREKRAPMETSPGEFRGPKRRLVKSFSVAGDDDMDRRLNSQDSFEDHETNFEESIDSTRSKILSSTKSLNISTEDSLDEKVQINEEDETHDKQEEEEQSFDPSMPKFETNKEKECWIMYKKMSDKGLPVSFDTILRGMLTPTEYRSVRKEIQTTS